MKGTISSGIMLDYAAISENPIFFLWRYGSNLGLALPS
jgi:hypothetical protein